MQTLRRRWQRLIQSFGTRLFFSFILGSALTSILSLLVVAVIAVLVLLNLPATEYRFEATADAAKWLTGVDIATRFKPEDAALASDNNQIRGYSVLIHPLEFVLIATADYQVAHVHGNGSHCEVGQDLRVCAPQFVDHAEGEKFIQMGDRRLVEIVLELRSGERLIAHYAAFQFSDLFASTSVSDSLEGLDIFSALVITLIAGGWTAIVGIPIAYWLVWRTMRPLTRRLTKIIGASQQFANGNMRIRVNDAVNDEIGQLGAQFDSMADALAQHVTLLREMAQHNVNLMQQAEQSAIHFERLKLSRDLHDHIAQGLFSLTYSTSAIPDLILKDPARAIDQARQIAGQTEQTLSDVRTLLVGLRQSETPLNNLSRSLRTICETWEQSQGIAIDLSIVLSGNYLPMELTSTVLAIAQEALNNVAKHAQATTVVISLVEGKTQVVLSVSDNGKGFEQAEGGIGKFGLLTMRERAQALGGITEIESQYQRGSTVRAILPLM